MLRCFFAVCAALFVFSFALGGPIHDAAKAGDVARVAKLLDTDKTLIEADDGNGWTPLHHAAYAGRLDVCKLLIQRGASINHLDREGNPSLAQAAGAGHAAVVQLLLEHGAWPNTADRSGNTPVIWAAWGGSLETMRALVSHGAKLSVQDRTGQTPLHHAAYHGWLAMVRWLIGKKCDVNAKAEHDVAPLHWAVEHNHADVAQALIAAGADVECRRTEDGALLTPLLQAARDGALDCERVLVAAKANVEAQDAKGNRPLHHAASQGNALVVADLLKHGANPNALNREKWTPLHFSAWNGNAAATEALVAAGASVDARGLGAIANTPLTCAALNNRPDLVAFLISKGANVNSKGDPNPTWPDNNAETVLHFAVRSGNPKIIQMLLDAHADPRVKDGFGEDAIAYATKKGQPDMAAMMARAVGIVLQQPKSAAFTEKLSETFAGGYCPTLWELAADGGSVASTGDGVELRPNGASTAYCGLRLRKGALPSGSDWRLTFAAKYSKVALYGRGWGIASCDDPKTAVFWVHADAGFTPCINHGSDSVILVGKGDWTEYPALHVLAHPAEWMTFEVVNAQGVWSISLDGKHLVDLRPPKGDYTLYFGPETSGLAPGPWTTVAIRSVTLEYPDGALPAWFAEARDAIAVAVAKGSVSALAGPGLPASARSGPAGLARDVLGISGVDTAAPAPLQLIAGGRPRITARSTTIQAAPLSVVEFAPTVDRPDFQPQAYYLVVNGPEVKKLDVFPKDRPVFSVEVPETVGTHTHVRIVAADARNVQQEAMRADVYAADPAKEPQTKLKLSGEKVVLSDSEAGARGTYLFVESEYVGQLTDPKSFSVDARRLPAARLEFYVVSRNSLGDLMPAAQSAIDIRPRYRIESPRSGAVFSVEGRDTSMPWTITREPATGIAKSRVYLRGTLIAESDKPSFDTQVSLLDVPSGDAQLDVVGVAADGTLYAPESRTFQVRNPVNDALIARDARGKTLQEMLSRMSWYDQQVAYWYSMAASEPAFRTFFVGRTYYTVDEFGFMACVGYLDSITVRGNAQEYLARCRAAIVERAGFRLEIGKLQKQLGLRSQAKSTLEQVVYEVGEGSGLGLAAQQELRGL